MLNMVHEFSGLGVVAENRSALSESGGSAEKTERKEYGFHKINPYPGDLMLPKPIPRASGKQNKADAAAGAASTGGWGNRLTKRGWLEFKLAEAQAARTQGFADLWKTGMKYVVAGSRCE
jgi:hypothetical protein